MRNRLIGIVAVLMMSMPLTAHALIDERMSNELLHLLAQVAFLKAEQSGNAIGCALVASKQVVAPGETFVLAWSSYGANDPGQGQGSEWARNGITTLKLEKPGTYRYEFVFYNAVREKTTCRADVGVVAAR